LIKLLAFDYPGNIRELRNIIESSVIHCRHEGLLAKDDLPPLANTEASSAGKSGWPMESLNFRDVERQLYEEALGRSENNASAAARLLGLSRGKFRRRVESLGIQCQTT
jgi:two-component system response regulator AtoC